MIGTVSLLVELEPAVDRLLGVVVALHDRRRRTCRTSSSFVGGMFTWYTRLAVLAHPPAGQAVEHDLARHVEVDREVERAAVEHAVELLGLVQRAGEAVEHEAVLQRAAGREALLDRRRRRSRRGRARRASM